MLKAAQRQPKWANKQGIASSLSRGVAHRCGRNASGIVIKHQVAPSRTVNSRRALVAAAVAAVAAACNVKPHLPL